MRKKRHSERMAVSTLALSWPFENLNIRYTGTTMDTSPWWHIDSAQMGVKYNSSEGSEQIIRIRLSSLPGQKPQGKAHSSLPGGWSVPFVSCAFAQSTPR